MTEGKIRRISLGDHFKGARNLRPSSAAWSAEPHPFLVAVFFERRTLVGTWVPLDKGSRLDTRKQRFSGDLSEVGVSNKKLSARFGQKVCEVVGAAMRVGPSEPVVVFEQGNQ